VVGGKLSRVEIRRLGPNDGTALEAAVRAFRGFELVPLHAGAACCSGTVTVSAAELPNRQRFFPGTTAWRSSYGRGQVVEGVNGMLKGGFLNIQHKFFRVFGLTKMTLMLAFTLVGYNLDAIRSFRAKKAAEKLGDARRTRKKRREGTWPQLLESDASGSRPLESGRAPPPA